MSPTSNTYAALASSIETELAILVRLLEYQSRRAAAYGELDRTSYLVARTLEVAGPVSIQDMATILGLEPTTVTRKISKMERGGFIRRSVDDEDRRRSMVSLSPKGVDAVQRLQAHRDARIEALVRSWPLDDVRTFRRLFGEFNRALASHADEIELKPGAWEYPAPTLPELMRMLHSENGEGMTDTQG